MVWYVPGAASCSCRVYTVGSYNTNTND
jgi:hypothetical protein